MGQKAYTLGISVRRHDDGFKCHARLEDHAGIDDTSVGNFKEVKAAVDGALTFLIEKYRWMASEAKGQEHARRCRGIADRIEIMLSSAVKRAVDDCIRDASSAFSVAFVSTDGLDEEATTQVQVHTVTVETFDDAPPMLLM